MRNRRYRLWLPLASVLGMTVAGPSHAATQRGQASWYGRFHEGKMMANHKPFRMMLPTVAHRTLPLGTMVEVRNLANGRVTEAEVTDRGPYARRRVLDVSKAVAERLGMLHAGTAPVEIRVLGEVG